MVTKAPHDGPALHGVESTKTPPISTAVNPAASSELPIAGIGDTTAAEHFPPRGVTPAQRGGRMPPTETVPLPGSAEEEALKEAEAVRLAKEAEIIKTWETPLT